MIRVSCLLFDGFVLLDMAGPITSFETASQCGVPGYSIEMLAATKGNVTSSCGVTVGAKDFRRTRGCDILLVPGGVSIHKMQSSAPLIAFVRKVAKRGGRVASVCSGAFLLAEAGLLAGRTAAAAGGRRPSWRGDIHRSRWTRRVCSYGMEISGLRREYRPELISRLQ